MSRPASPPSPISRIPTCVRSWSEPDWRRYPGWATVTESEWRDPQWQRAHSVKNIGQLRAVVGDLLDERFYDDLLADQQQRATMSMLLPPQMLNTVAPHCGQARRGLTEAFYADPIRRYMLPVLSDRNPHWSSHPYAERDSLHESDMWVVEALTHPYPTKVLAELLSTCPQYCVGRRPRTGFGSGIPHRRSFYEADPASGRPAGP